mgnify:CR=1 FL=1
MRKLNNSICRLGMISIVSCMPIFAKADSLAEIFCESEIETIQLLTQKIEELEPEGGPNYTVRVPIGDHMLFAIYKRDAKKYGAESKRLKAENERLIKRINELQFELHKAGKSKPRQSPSIPSPTTRSTPRSNQCAAIQYQGSCGAWGKNAFVKNHQTNRAVTTIIAISRDDSDYVENRSVHVPAGSSVRLGCTSGGNVGGIVTDFSYRLLGCQ